MIPYLRCLRHRDVPSPDNVTVCRCFDTDSRHGYSFKNPVLGRLDGPGLDGDASWQARRHSLPALPRRNRRALQRIWQVPITKCTMALESQFPVNWCSCEPSVSLVCIRHIHAQCTLVMIFKIWWCTVFLGFRLSQSIHEIEAFRELISTWFRTCARTMHSFKIVMLTQYMWINVTVAGSQLPVTAVCVFAVAQLSATGVCVYCYFFVPRHCWRIWLLTIIKVVSCFVYCVRL